MAGLTSILVVANPHRGASAIHQSVSEKLTVWSARHRRCDGKTAAPIA
jgi:hypothetical protein